VACLENNYSSVAFLDNYVKNGKIVENKYYYVIYDNCDENIRNEFLREKNLTELVLSRNPIGKYDEKDNLICIFYSKAHCTVIDNQIGQKLLEKALYDKSDNLYYGYKYKQLEPMLYY
jgi:hypothetical protein